MMGCNEIKKLIDEADRPDLLPFEAARHVDACAGCESFARERASLRHVLASGSRVAVPVNFDAVLRQRLEQRMARKTFAWLSPAGYLRFGVAAAALMIAIFAAQNLSIFSGVDQPVTPATVPAEAAAASQPSAPGAAKAGNVATKAPTVAEPPRQLVARTMRAPARHPRVALVGTSIAERDLPKVNVIVRDTDGERELSMSPVSIGAQSAILTNSGRTMPRTVAVSF